MDDNPTLIFAAEIDRRRYFRRFMWLLLATVATVGALIALEVATEREEIAQADEVLSTLLRAGQWVSLLIILILVLHMLRQLYYWLTTRSESVRVYDRGFIWARGKNRHKYGWGQIRSFQRGARRATLFGRPILQHGAHTITTRDGNVFHFTPQHGNTDEFARIISPYVADIIGTAMGRALRNGRTVRVHDQLVLHSAGVMAGKEKIRWSQLDIDVKNGRMTVLKHVKGDKFKPVKSFDVRRVNNIDGFLDVAHSTIRNHQPARFNIKTQTTAMDY